MQGFSQKCGADGQGRRHTLQIKVTGWKSQQYSGKHSHCGRSVELSLRITTFIPQTEENFHSIHPAKDLSPQDSDTGSHHSQEWA